MQPPCAPRSATPRIVTREQGVADQRTHGAIEAGLEPRGLRRLQATRGSPSRAAGRPPCSSTAPTSQPPDLESGESSTEPPQHRAERPPVLPASLHHETTPCAHRVARPCCWRGSEGVFPGSGPLVQEVRAAETHPHL